MKTAKRDKSFLIGGPSRCGKTTLANALFDNHGRVVGLPVEGLFHVFYQRSYPCIALQRGLIVREYLETKRVVDEVRAQRRSPADYLDADVGVIAGDVSAVSHPMQAVDHALTRFAEAHKGAAWAVCDLNAEQYFEAYRRIIPDLGLIIMLRDPFESVCASLYWRFYPEGNPRVREVIEYATMSWIYSAQSYLVLKERYASDVDLLVFNRLLSGDNDECSKLSVLLDLPEDVLSKRFNQEPDYSFKDGIYRCPGGEYSALMSDENLSFVWEYCGPLMKRLGWDDEAYKAFTDFGGGDARFAEKCDKMLSLCQESPERAMEFFNLNISHVSEAYRRKKAMKPWRELKRNARNMARIICGA